jgi:hypothetical protein
MSQQPRLWRLIGGGSALANGVSHSLSICPVPIAGFTGSQIVEEWIWPADDAGRILTNRRGFSTAARTEIGRMTR